MSTLKVDTIQTASGVEVYTAKVWVNFNGEGTVSIRNDGNASSITDNGTGDYTVNYTAAMVDADYAVLGAASCSTSGSHELTFMINSSNYNAISAPSTTASRHQMHSGGYGDYDGTYLSVAVFR